jgi:hypothetical protein
MIDDRLARVLAQLPAEDADWLARQINTAPWQLRQRRLGERDEAIRAARRFFHDARATVAARALEAALGAYLASAWPRERDLAELPPDAGERRAALHCIARLNDGDGLSWRQVWNIWGGDRRGGR